ncbi:MAG: hypothetical protein QXX89_07135 [Ignisphaera sp.]
MNYASIIIIYVVSSIVTIISAVSSIAIEKKFRFLCKDVHKPYEHFVPCIGGFSLYLGFCTGLYLMFSLNMINRELFTVSMLSVSIATFIGFLDDINGLRSRWKILLGFLPAIPILVSGCYVPRPWLPFIGHTRIHIIYPLLILLSSTVYINGANMIDTHNGTLPMFVFTISLFTFLLKLSIHAEVQDIYIALLIVVVIASYLVFNIYPAKLFNGNTGSHLLGSLIFLITVLFRLEFFVILASIPMFLNGFYYISSVKGFIQKEKIDRPTYVDRDGCIYPKPGIHPLTFVKILLMFAKDSFSEKELVAIMYSIYLYTSFLSFMMCILLGYS